ncbi:SDR family oxidoreductase [Desulfonatronum thiodismutans]|uniref:SDR family oxidoreductase n=1 Tax=Desulfonatronum thiodismutans TaxID=159290 RepID=UPI0004ABDC58|nr:SDR family oxidoreductase [Desulfonatronum thiodismutans]
MNILIIGATSAIATASARRWAASQASFFLVGRNKDHLQQIGDDLLVRGASATHHHVLDVNAFDDHEAMIKACFSIMGKVDVVLVAHGTLPDQQACQRDVGLMLREFSTNGLSVIALLTLLANRLESQGSGTIAVISSVAGDRGRSSNYLYGSAKASVNAFCEGMRARLFKSGVHVLTIKPGFVDTPMTQGLALPKLLLVGPDRVAADIVKAVDKGKSIVYTPWFWRWIMAIIRSIPGVFFRRMNI